MTLTADLVQRHLRVRCRHDKSPRRDHRWPRSPVPLLPMACPDWDVRLGAKPNLVLVRRDEFPDSEGAGESIRQVSLRLCRDEEAFRGARMPDAVAII